MNYSSAKYIRAYILISIGLVVLWLVWFSFTHKFFSLEINNPDSISNIDSATVSSSTGDELSSLFGIYSLPNSATTVNFATEGDQLTVVPAATISKLNLPLEVKIEKQRQTTARQSHSLGCSNLDENNQVITYRCGLAAESLMQIDASGSHPWKNQRLTNVTPNVTYSNYLNGVIAVDSETDSIETFDTSGKTATYQVADNLKDSTYLEIAVDNSDKTNQNFIVYDVSSGDMAYYNFENGQLDIYQIEVQAPDISDVRHKCRLVSDQAICLRGFMKVPSGHNPELADQPQLLQADLSSKKPQASLTEIKTNLDFINDIHIDQKQNIFLVNDNQLLYYESGNIIPILAGSVDIEAGDKLLIATENGVYGVNPETKHIHLIYSHEATTISALSVYGDSYLFDTQIAEGDLFRDPIIMQIGHQAATNDKSLLDVMPIDTTFLPIMSAAIYNNQLQIQPETFYTSDQSSNSLTYDRQTYNSNKQAIERYLDKLKADKEIPADLKVIYSY